MVKSKGLYINKYYALANIYNWRKQNMAKRGPKPKKELDRFRRPDGTVDYTLARTVRRQEKKAEQRKIAEQNKDLIFEKGTRVKYLQCPICYRRVPLAVKTVSQGDPIDRHEVGVRIGEYPPDGVLRSFTGPDPGYRPVVAYYFYGRYGSLEKPEEGFTPRRLFDEKPRLYHDLREAIFGAYKACIYSIYFDKSQPKTPKPKRSALDKAIFNGKNRGAY